MTAYWWNWRRRVDRLKHGAKCISSHVLLSTMMMMMMMSKNAHCPPIIHSQYIVKWSISQNESGKRRISILMVEQTISFIYIIFYMTRILTVLLSFFSFFYFRSFFNLSLYWLIFIRGIERKELKSFDMSWKLLKMKWNNFSSNFKTEDQKTKILQFNYLKIFLFLV